MFSRTTSQGSGILPGHDPLPVRIASAAVVLGLLATGFVVVSRDAVAPGGPVARRTADRRPAVPPSGPQAGLASGPMAAAGRSLQARGTGLRLLGQAAAACQSIAYQGVQVIASQTPAGRRVSVVDVWHKSGHPALIAGTSVSTGSYAQDLAPILSMTQQMVALLGANYEVAVAGGGQADGRPAQVVEVRTAAGRLTARFWLDSATKLPLRRQVFDVHAQVVSEDTFVSLRLGADAVADAPTAGARPRSSLLSGDQLARLRAEGWPLPGPLPGRLTVLEARSTVTTSGSVVELSYSDGLSVVSLFVQRGHLPSELSGWSEVALEGQRVYAADPDDRSVAWSADGFVYTVIADAPGQTVDQVVAALPHDARPGPVTRLIRGLHRLFSWADPFR